VWRYRHKSLAPRSKCPRINTTKHRSHFAFPRRYARQLRPAASTGSPLRRGWQERPAPETLIGAHAGEQTALSGTILVSVARFAVGSAPSRLKLELVQAFPADMDGCALAGTVDCAWHRQLRPVLTNCKLALRSAPAPLIPLGRRGLHHLTWANPKTAPCPRWLARSGETDHPEVRRPSPGNRPQPVGVTCLRWSATAIKMNPGDWAGASNGQKAFDTRATGASTRFPKALGGRTPGGTSRLAGSSPPRTHRLCQALARRKSGPRGRSRPRSETGPRLKGG
jgi:hypothetical protein